MRVLAILLFMATLISVLYKWRYRITNTLLAISFLRKLAFTVSMNMPAIRAKVLPGLFNKQANS